MSPERFIDRLKLLSPAERERRDAKFLADRFDAIKSHLKELDVNVYLGTIYVDDTPVTIIELGFDKRREEEVRDELANAEIREIYNPWAQVGKWIAIAAEFGFNDEFPKKAAKKRRIIIYEGKNILEEDIKRLTTLEPGKVK